MSQAFLGSSPYFLPLPLTSNCIPLLDTPSDTTCFGLILMGLESLPAQFVQNSTSVLGFLMAVHFPAIQHDKKVHRGILRIVTTAMLCTSLWSIQKEGKMHIMLSVHILQYSLWCSSCLAVYRCCFCYDSETNTQSCRKSSMKAFAGFIGKFQEQKIV